MAGRPPLPIGTWGTIRYEGAAGAWTARTQYRDVDGITRGIKRTRPTKGAARDALTAALTDRTTPSTADLDGSSPLRDAIRLWITDRERAHLAANTLRRYREIATDVVDPALGAVRLRECTVARLDAYLRKVTDTTGPATAMLARTVLSGALGVAVRYGALATNPIRDVSGITVAPRDPQALTLEQVRAVRAACLTWQAPTGKAGRPRTMPLLDVVDMLLATGARIGEVLALRWADVDLEAGTVTITGTVAMTDAKPARPFRQEHPKSSSSRRALTLPDHAVALLTRRRVAAEGNAHDVVFPTRTGSVMDPSNFRSRLRDALKPAGLAWVTPHTFRRTVATALDAAESTRVAADQLGHAGEDVTRRHYVQRTHVGPDAREHLAALFG